MSANNSINEAERVDSGCLEDLPSGLPGSSPQRIYRNTAMDALREILTDIILSGTPSDVEAQMVVLAK